MDFRWTERTNKAAILVAEDRLTDTEIAQECGVAQRTLERWKQSEAFQARVSELVAAYRERILREGIADRVKRVKALDDRWRRMQQVIEERATDPQMAHVPGGTSGLLCHTIKGVGRGDDFQLIDLYAVDDGLLSEMRATEKQAAIEAGQWEEKRDITSGGKPLPGINLLGLSEISDEELDRRIASAKGRTTETPVPE